MQFSEKTNLSNRPTEQIVEEKWLVKIADMDAIEEVTANVVLNNLKEAEAF